MTEVAVAMRMMVNGIAVGRDQLPTEILLELGLRDNSTIIFELQSIGVKIWRGGCRSRSGKTSPSRSCTRRRTGQSAVTSEVLLSSHMQARCSSISSPAQARRLSDGILPEEQRVFLSPAIDYRRDVCCSQIAGVSRAGNTTLNVCDITTFIQKAYD